MQFLGADPVDGRGRQAFGGDFTQVTPLAADGMAATAADDRRLITFTGAGQIWLDAGLPTGFTLSAMPIGDGASVEFLAAPGVTVDAPSDLITVEGRFHRARVIQIAADHYVIEGGDAVAQAIGLGRLIFAAPRASGHLLTTFA